MPHNYVLYHASCFDGSGAAYAAWAALGDEGTTYLPVQYGQEPPEMESGSNVYIVDFSYPKDVLTALLGASQKLVVLDHHKTAKEALEGFPGALFDMNKSGAVLAWEYFHPGQQPPVLLEHIQDRDLWRWKIPGTREATAALWLHKDFREFGELDLTTLYNEGGVKTQFDDMELDSALKKTIVTRYGRYTCAFLNTTVLVSEIGSHLCNELPVDFSLSYFVEKSGDIAFGFRSVGDFDVSAMAKELGGGGHKNAAGARVKSAQGFAVLQQLYSNRITTGD